MNILITTISLLLVLGVSASLFWKETLSSAYAMNAAKGFFEASRVAQNKAEHKRFSRWKEVNSSTPTKKTLSSRKKDFISHRYKNPPLEQGRLRIAPIWNEEHKTLFQPVVERLFFDLYGHAPWFDKAKSTRLVEAIAKIENSFDKNQFAETLDKELYAIWYLMERGTQVYDTDNKIGYPPLLDYVDFSPSPAKHACHFPFAPVPVLKAIFGTEITKSILEMERSKWEDNHRHRFCLKRELIPFLKTNKQGSQLMNFVETFLYFSQSVGRNSFVQGIEEKSGVVRRCKLRDDAKEDES